MSIKTSKVWDHNKDQVDINDHHRATDHKRATSKELSKGYSTSKEPSKGYI
jgi:hypothetical protein